jgi:hypothetical protein
LPWTLAVKGSSVGFPFFEMLDLAGEYQFQSAILENIADLFRVTE